MNKKKIRETYDRVMDPFAKSVAVHAVGTVMGSWMLYHLAGGLGGLRDAGVPKSTAYLALERFRKILGTEIDHFVFNTDEAEILIEYLRTHNSPEARRLINGPSSSRDRVDA